jgi:hypothetical protein
MGNHVVEEKLREPFVWRTMGAGAKTFLPFNFTDMTVGGNNIVDNREESGANAFKLLVAVDAGNIETAAGVGVDRIG